MSCTDHWHRTYHLDCDQFAALKAFACGLCNICGMRERYTPNGLYIDHDHDLGMWAVRGLLCPRCNTVIEVPGVLVGPERDEYLSFPWHVRAGLAAPAVVGRRTAGGMPHLRADDPLREELRADLDRLGAQFAELRGPRRTLTPAARQFAKSQIHPALSLARAAGLTCREIGIRTGYTPEYVQVITSRHHPQNGVPAPR